METAERDGDEGCASKSVEALERAEQGLKKAEGDLKVLEGEVLEAESEIERAEHEIEIAKKELKNEPQHVSYELIVNRVRHIWPREEITGAEIKKLAGSPSDWVVNQIVDGPGEDPEILDAQVVHLSFDACPKGEKRFTTRKPKTSPGA
jgi:hypothetical protein